MNKWIAEFELEDGDTMPEHMDLKYKGAKIDFHCKPLEREPCEDAVSRQAVIDMTGLSEWFDSSDSYNEFVIALSELPSVTPQEPKILVLLEKTYADFCNCDGGESWLKIDDKEYVTDAGYAIEGVEIFMEVFKRRLAESEEYVNFADDLMPIMDEEESEDDEE